MKIQALAFRNLNKSYYVYIAALLFVLRLIGDIVLFILDKYDATVIFVWKPVTSIVIIVLLALYFHKKITSLYDNPEVITNEEFFRELKRFLLLTLAIMCGNLLFFLLPEYSFGATILSVIIWDTVSIFTVSAALYGIYFLYKWLTIRRHKKTKTYIMILRNILFYFIIVEILVTYIDSLDNRVVSILSIVLKTILVIACFLAVKKNSWVALLPRSQKVRLIWLSFFGFLMSMTISVFSIEDSFNLHKAMLIFMPGTAALAGITYVMFGIYCLRLFITAILAMPTSGIVERHASEISSLTYLNRIVAETIDFNTLLENVTRLAASSIGGIAAWIELYTQDGKVVINSAQNITEEQIKKLDKQDILLNTFRNILTPLIVDSIPDSEEMSYLDWKAVPSAKSLVAVPLYSGEEKIGTLVVLNPEEYGFEHDDVKVLSAFSDNVSIALENARLLKDSIEKERYKKELFLAREMEEKLLPQVLPKIDNYYLAAFSIPAEEVGGDYYDIVKLKDGRHCILIGDVSGKGISAAFYMAQLKGVALAVAQESVSAADILCRVNKTLYRALDKHTYITLSAVVIENDSGKISFARGGHMPVIICRDSSAEIITPKGLGIGLTDSRQFGQNLESVELNLSKGDTCLLFTDGLSELRNTNNEEFGYDKLKQILISSVNKNRENLIFEIKEALREHSGNLPPHDDMTVVVISYIAD